MIPKDPVYLLTAAIERVKDTIPDQDAEGWLRDAIAADHIEWAYVVWEKDKGRSFQSFIDIVPNAAIMPVPDLKIDWPTGMATVQRRRGVVECPIVVSRRDLDRELANITASPEATDHTRSGMAGAEDRNDERPELKQDEDRPPDKQQRTRDVQAEALLKNHIEAVLAKAKDKWPNSQKRPGVNQMARLLVTGQPKNKVEGFGEEAIRKILAGTYKPAKDRGIPGLSSR